MNFNKVADTLGYISRIQRVSYPFGLSQFIFDAIVGSNSGFIIAVV
jgi:hypothetical protein